MRRISEARSGKIPTTFERRFTSLCRRQGVRGVQVPAMLDGQVHVGEHVLTGVSEKLGGPGEPLLERSRHLVQLDHSRAVVWLGEDRAHARPPPRRRCGVPSPTGCA